MHKDCYTKQWNTNVSGRIFLFILLLFIIGARVFTRGARRDTYCKHHGFLLIIGHFFFSMLHPSGRRTKPAPLCTRFINLEVIRRDDDLELEQRLLYIL